jgi:hypothetical protein
MNVFVEAVENFEKQNNFNNVKMFHSCRKYNIVFWISLRSLLHLKCGCYIFFWIGNMKMFFLLLDQNDVKFSCFFILKKNRMSCENESNYEKRILSTSSTYVFFCSFPYFNLFIYVSYHTYIVLYIIYSFSLVVQLYSFHLRKQKHFCLYLLHTYKKCI